MIDTSANSFANAKASSGSFHAMDCFCSIEFTYAYFRDSHTAGANTYSGRPSSARPRSKGDKLAPLEGSPRLPELQRQPPLDVRAAATGEDEGGDVSPHKHKSRMNAPIASMPS